MWAAAAQAAAQPWDHISRIDRWVEAALHHQPGSLDDDAVAVASWSNAELQTLWVDLNVLGDLLRDPKATRITIKAADGKMRQVRVTPNELTRLRDIARRVHDAMPTDDVLRRGALLHTDIAMNVHDVHEPIGTPNPYAPERITVQVGDGQALDMGSRAIHWDTARMLVDRTPRDDFARSWYRATSAWMQDREDHDMDHVAHAVALFPADPDLLFLDGCMHEVLASPSIQASVQAMRLPAGFSMNVGSMRGELKLAENALRQAVARRPEFAEAHLHYGRVVDLLGDHQLAVQELSQAAGALDDDALEYFDDLFTGAAQESLGRYAEAQAEYESAATRQPDAQSPLLALAELARRRGDRAAALAALARLAALRGGERDDAWWWYSNSQARNAGDMLEALWRPFIHEASK